MKRAVSRNLLITITIASLLPALSFGDVSVRLSETTITQDKPVQVTFEASGPSVALPDLAPIQADFEILNRGVQQRSSTINGRRTQWTTLSLTLRAKRTGNLEIPRLQFGGETSRPEAIRVLAGTEPTKTFPSSQSQGAPPWDSQGPWDPFGMQTPQFAPPWGGSNLGVPSFPMGGGAPSPSAGFPVSPPASQGSGPFRVPMTTPSESVTRLQYTPESAGEVPPTPGDTAGKTWSWIAGFATASWLGTLFLCWLRRRRRIAQELHAASLQTPSTQAVQPEPESEESKALRAVAEAYSRGDAGAARGALLAWAKLIWPANPPGNLSRLAGRLAEPLRGYVLELDEALYSPTPVPWEQRPVVELLRTVPI